MAKSSLGLALRMADASEALLQRTQCFQERSIFTEKQRDPYIANIDPMLLGLAMEIALKAWYVLDYGVANGERSHKLWDLFKQLKEESREKLRAEFLRTVAPGHPDILSTEWPFSPKLGTTSIENTLKEHENAFIEWRYSYEHEFLRFNTGKFKDTLVMIIRMLHMHCDAVHQELSRLAR